MLQWLVADDIAIASFLFYFFLPFIVSSFFFSFLPFFLTLQ